MNVFSSIKRILIFLSLFIVLIIIGGLYWYFNIYQKPISEKTPEQSSEELEVKKILEEWLNVSLKPEFLPSKLNIELGVDIGGGVTRDKNTFGYNWNILEKNFYSAIDYNNKKPGINAYILAVFWDEKIDLDQEVALELLENYFNFPRFDLKCETIEIEGEGVNPCQGSWRDEKESWHNLSGVSGEEREITRTILIYYLTPLGSETYKERPF